MSIPATVCPLCALTVPTNSMNSHMTSHSPNKSNEDMAETFDSGLERE